MDQWNHPSHQNHQNHQNPSTSTAHAHMGHVVPQPKEEVQYMMRQVTDSVRFAMCEAIGHRTALWDSSREKCSSAARKKLFGEVVGVINSQFVLSPPMSIEEIEKHWKNLKDTYVKTRRKITYDQDGCLIRPKWKFFEALTFLDAANQSDFAVKKRNLSMSFPGQSYDLYHGPPVKKDKLDEIPTDEYMEFCRSLYLPLKEIGYKDRVQWLKIQKTIRDVVYEAQLESVTKAPPDIQ